MPRYRLTIEYDGGPFAGWQSQEGEPSVQARLAVAVRGFTGEDVTVFGAGRTDAGVHALGQVAHVDLARDWPEDTVRDALNQHLRPAPVAVLAAARVPPGFDARFSAIRRHYRYRIVNRRSPLTIDRGRAWQVAVPLAAEAMDRAAQALPGHHDFTTFRSVHCQAKSPVKTLDAIAVARTGEEIEVTVSARSFMHRQVRSIVGSLKCVGEGKWPEARMADALAARDRAACGPVAPADGLYLVRVDYPE
jgi:tRNA pseudouridine38-40 synthase